jgi:Rod binding domain-containing protein
MDAVESIGMPAPPGPGRGQPWTSTDIQDRRRPGESGNARASARLTGEARRLDEQEKQIGKDFESVLLTKLFEQVQASIQDSGFDEEDSGAQQVRGLFWLHLAQDVADKGGFGLWKDIYQHIKQVDGMKGLTGSMDEEL